MSEKMIKIEVVIDVMDDVTMCAATCPYLYLQHGQDCPRCQLTGEFLLAKRGDGIKRAERCRTAMVIDV